MKNQIVAFVARTVAHKIVDNVFSYARAQTEPFLMNPVPVRVKVSWALNRRLTGIEIPSKERCENNMRRSAQIHLNLLAEAEDLVHRWVEDHMLSGGAEPVVVEELRALFKESFARGLDNGLEMMEDLKPGGGKWVEEDLRNQFPRFFHFIESGGSMDVFDLIPNVRDTLAENIARNISSN